MQPFKKICLIIPAFNSEKTIKKVVSEIKNFFPEIKIIIVDDGSTDNTYKIASQLDTIILKNKKNMGVGAALKNGLKYGLENNFDIFITIGADDQRDVTDIKFFLEGLSNDYDLVIGSKFLYPHQKIPLFRKLGNFLINKTFNFLFNTHFSDVCSGFRAFNKKIAESVFNLSDSYSFDAELYLLATRKNFRILEVPVKVFYKQGSTRMKNSFLVGLKIILKLFELRFLNSKTS